jgi:hypothetical protein
MPYDLNGCTFNFCTLKVIVVDNVHLLDVVSSFVCLLVDKFNYNNLYGEESMFELILSYDLSEYFCEPQRFLVKIDNTDDFYSNEQKFTLVM